MSCAQANLSFFHAEWRADRSMTFPEGSAIRKQLVPRVLLGFITELASSWGDFSLSVLGLVRRIELGILPLF
jgi:hypothetical protein